MNFMRGRSSSEVLKLVMSLDLDWDALSCGVGNFENPVRLGTEQQLSWLLALTVNRAEEESR
jgi:hypothetical protein